MVRIHLTIGENRHANFRSTSCEKVRHIKRECRYVHESTCQDDLFSRFISARYNAVSKHDKRWFLCDVKCPWQTDGQKKRWHDAKKVFWKIQHSQRGHACPCIPSFFRNWIFEAQQQHCATCRCSGAWECECNAVVSTSISAAAEKINWWGGELVKKKIVKCIQQLSGRYSPTSVFFDWVQCMSHDSWGYMEAERRNV